MSIAELKANVLCNTEVSTFISNNGVNITNKLHIFPLHTNFLTSKSRCNKQLSKNQCFTTEFTFSKYMDDQTLPKAVDKIS